MRFSRARQARLRAKRSLSQLLSVAFLLSLISVPVFVKPTQALEVTSGSCTATVNNTTGVSVTQTGTSCEIKFKTSGISYTWTTPSHVSTYEVLLVGGGGGGAFGNVGGGGGGGEVVVTNSAITATPGEQIAIAVGAGGASGATGGNDSSAGAEAAWKYGGDGGVSSFGTFAAYGGGGGGGGGGAGVRNSGNPGGSGGGSNFSTNSPGVAQNHTYANWTSYANSGGGGNNSLGGGGGGAGGAGNLNSSGVATQGRGGMYATIWGLKLAGGGGGWSNSYGSEGTAAATELGGNARTSGSGYPYNGNSFGVANTGTGGGAGAPGGSGIVVVRYQVAFNVTYDSNGGSSVTSGTFTAGGSIPSAPISPTLSGYRFAGWSATNGGSIISFPYSPGVSSNITLYANWIGTPFLSYNSSDLNSYNSSGTSVTDLSTNGFNGTTTGSVGFDSSTGTSSGSWSLPGGTNAAGPYIDVANLSSNNFSSGFTIDFEADFGSQKNSFERIIDFGEGGQANDNVIVSRDGTTSNLFLEVWRGNVGSRCTYTNGISEGVLTRYTIAINGSTCRIFKDAAASPDYSASYTTLPVSGLTLSDNFIGKSNWSADAQYEGKIRSLRIYASAFTPAQIDSLSYKTVTFNTNGGSATGITSGVTSGKLKLATAPTQTGYTFNGWYDSSSSGNLVGAASAEYTPTATGTLYAQWTLNNYSVTLNRGTNGTGSDQVLTKSHGSNLTLPDLSSANSYFTRSGYVVTGWSTSSSGASKTYELGGSYSTESATTLYPYWEADLIAYESFNGSFTNLTGFSAGTGSSGFSSSWTLVNSGNASGSAATTLIRQTTTSDFRQVFPPGVGFSLPSGNSQVGLSGGGPHLKQNARALTNSVSMDSTGTYYLSFLSADAYNDNQLMAGLLTGLPSSTSDTSKQAMFFGYVPDAGTNGQFAIDVGSANRAAACPDSAADTCTSTLAYTSKTSQSGGYTGQTISSGSNFAYFVLVKITATSSGSDTIQLKAFSYGSTIPSTDSSITWDLTYSAAVTGTYTHLSVQQTGSGYPYFDDLRLARSYTGAVNPTTTNTLTLDSNYVGGTTSTRAVSTGIATQVWNPFTRTSYTFAGWNTNSDGTSGTNYATTDLVTINSDTTLYAKWNRTTYSVTLNKGTTGTGSNQVLTKTNGTDLVLPDSATANSYFTRSGYMVSGWSASDGGSQAYALGGSYTTESAATLYPVWSLSTFSVTYNSNGGTSVTSGSFSNGGAISSAPTPPTKSGFTFDGWASTVAGSAITFPYTPGVTTDITLYARWLAASQLIDYSLTFDGSVNQDASATAVNVIPATGDFTVEAWIKPATDAPSYSMILSQGSSTTDGSFWINRTNVSGSYANKIAYRRPGAAYQYCDILALPSQWTHVAITFSGLNATCYINGDVADTFTASSWTTTTSGNFLVGNWVENPSNVNYRWKGALDEIRIYSTSRTQAQIQADLKSYGPINASGLAAYYDFNEGTGSKLNNLVPGSSSTTELTLNGSPTWADVATSSTSGNNSVVTFERSYLNNTGGWSTPANVTTGEVLIVGGGGGGGDSKSQDPNRATGGGGGAGGYFASSSVPLSGTISIGVGVGGSGSLATNTRAVNGSDSWLGTLKVGGGGGGNSYGYTAFAASSGNGGSDYLVGGNGGGGRAAQGSSIISKNGGTAGAYSLSGISFGGTTFNGSAGGAGGNAAGDYGTGGLGGSIAAASRTSSISGTSVEYARRSLYLPWSDSRNGTKTFGSGGSPNYVYGSAESAPNIYGGDGAQGVVIVSWQSTFSVTYNSNSGSSVASGSFELGGSIASAPTAPTRSGYSFSGWSATDGGSVISFPYSPGVSQNITLYAKWTSNTNTVTFNSNYGTPTTTTQSITTDVSTALTANSFTRTGYTFAGWNTNSDGTSGTSYSNGESVTISGPLTLYAKWTANSNTVTFNSNYGTPTTSTQSITSGTATALTTNSFTRTGYTFAGWNTNSDGTSGTDYSNGESVTIATSFTLYAKWTANSNTVTFNSNYGTPTTSTQSITSGTATALTANSFTRTGYTFAGWNTVAGGTGTSYTNSQSVTIYAPVTLYAQWTEINYTVTYNVNGASGSAEKSSEVYGISTGALTLPTVGTMTKTGYRFDGWATTNGGTKLTGTYTPTNDITLYARWVAASYSITYNDNGATSGSPSATSATYTTGGSAITLATQSTMAKSGYTFNGWSTTINDATTKILNSGSYTISAPVILYALWTADSYSITYSTQNYTSGSAPTDATTYNIGNVATVKANTALVRTGYSFAGWTTTSNNSGTVYQSGDTYTFGTSSITFYPKWSANTYNISYNTNGALSGSPSRTSDTYTSGNSGISLPNVGTMTRTGYDFSGWSTDPTGSAHAGTFTTTTDVTLYAIWTLKNITYTYARGVAESTNLTGSHIATFPNPTSISGLFGSSITLSSTISSTASVGANTYLFFGWNDGSTTFQPNNTFVLGESAPTFTAQWIRLYEVRYGLNGGTGIVDVDSECTQANNTCTANQPITLSAAPTRSGYTFAGWKDQSNTLFSAGQAINVTSSSYVFYAQWTAIDYSITFDSIGGSLSPATQTKNIGQTVTLPSPGTKTGYDFNGWTVGGVTYGVGTTYTVGTSNAAFTALWTAQRYNVSYNWNGGIGTPTSSSIYTVGDSAITLPSGSSHTKDGYVFDGWAVTDGGTKLTGSQTPTGDVMYYARWIDGSYTITYDTAGGTLGASSATVSRTNALTLPTPTRTNYTFDGWYTDSNTTLTYGAAGASITPTSSRTIYAKWVQNSLSGINPAHLNSLTTITITGAHTWSGTHSLSGTGASLSIPNGALPTGTVVGVSFVEDLSRPRSLIDNSYAYYTSVVLHWQLGTGSSATVPTAATGKPLSLTLTNPDIRAGAKIYKIIQGTATYVATATIDGEVTLEISEDPEIVVAATTPTAPRLVTATGNLNAQATVSWTAPVSSGGAEVTSYTVTASPGGATCTAVASTTCTVTGLTNDTSYTFTAIATNAVGNSSASSASSAVIPRLYPTFNATFDSKGGTSISDVLYSSASPIASPTAPTKSGYTFSGWLSTDGDTSTLVTFPYSPNSNSDVTLYAYWVAAAGSGGGASSSAPTVSPIINTPPVSRTNPSTNSPLINSPAKPEVFSAPVTKFPELADAPYPTNGMNVPQVGEVIALIDRQPVQLIITPQQTQTVVEFGSNLTMTFTSTNTAGQPIEVSPTGALTVIQGAYVQAAGSGFKPNSPVEAWLHSEPIRLGSGYSNNDGSFDNKFAIGKDIPLGKHTIVLNGLTSSNEIATLALGVQVKEPVVDVLPQDDPSSSIFTQSFRVVAALLFALVVVALIYLASRRRQP